MSSTKELRVAVREALVATLEDALNGGAYPYPDPYPYGDDPYDPYEVVTITYRPTRAPIRLPAVIFFDTGTRVDDQVPLFERLVHVDVWARDLDQAERIARKANARLDHQPLPLAGGEGLAAFLTLQSDQDQPQNDADLVRKMLTYRLLVYEYNGPYDPPGDST